MSANNNQVVSGQDAGSKKAVKQAKPAKKAKPAKSKGSVERITKEEIRIFRSGCACSFDMEADARFAERIRKQEEEDKRNGYVSPGEESDEESD
jgi:hypothetical protein